MKQFLLLMAICLTLEGFSQRVSVVPYYASGENFSAGIFFWQSSELGVVLEAKEVKVEVTPSSDILLWPMPFTDRINTNFAWKTVEVYSMEGRKVSDQLDNLSSLSPGFYVVRFNQTLSKTIVKQ